MVNFIGRFNVVPSLPKVLEPLREIAYNLHWTWNHETVELFRRMDRKMWESTQHNPVMMLGKTDQKRLIELSEDDGFLAHMNRVYSSLMTYMAEKTWYQKNYKKDENRTIAYFSAEFGLTECLQIYSGGLGILSGDHLKSASDLGLPLVGVGLCYKEGYFQQYLTADGWQQEKYDLVDFYNQPMKLVYDSNNNPIKLSLNFPGRELFFQIWKIQVGRVPLYLLDTNVPENKEEDKKITHTLYGGNSETRIQQEILLGIGGLRALQTMGIEPLVCHMNEGHSAFLSLERIRQLMSVYKISFQEAKDAGFFSNIFTTHTPVPAGIDIFPNEMMEKYFGGFYRNDLHMKDEDFYKLGTITDHNQGQFNMAHLAMNMAGFVNGVSKLHCHVSKKMWAAGFKDVPFEEIPIEYITNGIHTHSHLSNDIQQLLIRYLGERFLQDPSDAEIWERVDEIPDEELWRTHERRRERLVAFARTRLQKQITQRGGSNTEIAMAKEVLDASALTIGFARRFATYKRATLLLRDIERLAALLCNTNYPVQIIVAGKAHPRDEEGKSLIQEIVSISKEPHFRKRIVFIENYDMNVARYMVEGCDIWLNNPRRPLEASGTSGMKVIANGGLNFSILDGWWDEAYTHDVGWRIGNGEEYDDLDYQDELESRLIYECFEKEIVPLFYTRGDNNLPRNWIAMMKNSMKTLGPVYNTHRMVTQYFEMFYNRAFEKRAQLAEKGWKKAKDFSAWKSNLISNWDKIKVINFSEINKNESLKVGAKYSLQAEVDLGGLSPNDVEVQIYFGKMEDKNIQSNNTSINMNCVPGKNEGPIFNYKGEINCTDTGFFGFTLRILPKHPMLINQFELGLIKWA